MTVFLAESETSELIGILTWDVNFFIPVVLGLLILLWLLEVGVKHWEITNKWSVE